MDASLIKTPSHHREILPSFFQSKAFQKYEGLFPISEGEHGLVNSQLWASHTVPSPKAAAVRLTQNPLRTCQSPSTTFPEPRAPSLRRRGSWCATSTLCRRPLLWGHSSEHTDDLRCGWAVGGETDCRQVKKQTGQLQAQASAVKEVNGEVCRNGGAAALRSGSDNRDYSCTQSTPKCLWAKWPTVCCPCLKRH